MAVAISNIDSRTEDTWGRQRIRIVEVTFDDSYPTGGESLSPNDVALADIGFVAASPDASPYSVRYDFTDTNLVVFEEDDTEVSNGTDLSSLKVRLLIVGR